MKIYVLFERKTFNNGDRVVAVSTSERKIRKLLKETKEKVLEDETWIIDSEYKDSITLYDEDGNLYELEIQEHETLK